MPLRALLLFALLAPAWYLVCVLVFATEVAVRPPWYKTGLPAAHLPPYWAPCLRNPRADLAVHYHSVSFPVRNIPAHASRTLRGWYIGHSPRAVVFVHGAGRDRRAFLRHLPHFLARGFAALLFDLSEHGLSDAANPDVPAGTLFGAREQHDVLAAIDFAVRARGARRVVVVGTSCGASSAIQAVALRPAHVVAVVAENPFTRADHLLTHHLHQLSENYLSQNSHRTVRRAVFWLAGRLLMARMGYYCSPFGALDAVAHLPCPLLIAHSTADDIVPFQHGVAIYERAKACGRTARFVKFDDAPHCALFDKHPQKWVSNVLPFVTDAFEAHQSV